MTCRLSALVAIARNGVIGKNNELPWRLPADLKHFKALTMGHSIIMGRKTYESIGRLLPGRTSIIVTQQPEYKIENAIVAHSIEEALKACCGQDREEATGRECFVIGGAQIFRETVPVCDRMYITEIQRDFEGDVRFPEFDREEWMEVSREKHKDDNGLEYDFVVLDRKPNGPK
jgi:dihydrofolate reductase